MRATRILQDHRSELNRLAEALLEHETLNKEEIISVCRGEKLTRSNFVPEPKHSNEPEKESESEKESEKIVNGKIIKARGFTIFFNK